MHEHLSDTELARFATDPEALPLERRQVIEREIGHCAICRTSVDFFAVLGDVLLWDMESSKLERSRDDGRQDPNIVLARRIEAEDQEADEVLAREKVLDSPAKTAWRKFDRDKRLLTGGVVRRLNAHAHSLCEEAPLDALTFADAAISVAEVLPDDLYPRSAVYELRGTAWKERANALLRLGEFPAALEALDHAERAYRRLNSAGLGLSAVALVRASVLYEQGRLEEAAALTEAAEYGFAFMGEEELRMRAVFLRGSIKYEAGDVRQAVATFRQVLDHGKMVDSRRWVARASYALGNCETDLRNFAEASMLFHAALMIFHKTGPEPERLAAEWGLARVILQGGEREEAVRRLHAIASEFDRRALITYAALVRLDIVDALLAARETQRSPISLRVCSACSGMPACSRER